MTDMTDLKKMYQAIQTLRSGTDLSFKGDIVNEETFQTIDWHTGVDGDQAVTTKVNPHSELTWTKVKAEMDRSDAEYNAQDYARKRKAEYPIIADQLDDIYHNGIDGWKATIKITKDKYPKG